MKYNNSFGALVLCIALVPAVSFGMEHEQNVLEQPQSIWQKIVSGISFYMPARPEWTKNPELIKWASNFVTSLSDGQVAALRGVLSSGGYLATTAFKRGVVTPKHVTKAFKKGAQAGFLSYAQATGKDVLKQQMQKSSLDAYGKDIDDQIALIEINAAKVKKLKELLRERAEQLLAVDSKATLIKNKISDIKVECVERGDTGCVQQ